MLLDFLEQRAGLDGVATSVTNLLPLPGAVPRIVVERRLVFFDAFVGAVDGRRLIPNGHRVANLV